MKHAVRELNLIVRMQQESTRTRRALIGVTLGLANVFLCACYERYIADPDRNEAILTLLAIETSLLVIVAMSIHLQIIDPILRRTRLHPMAPSARFAFATSVLMRDRYVLMIWGSAILAMTLMVHPPAVSIPFVILSFLLPGGAFVMISATLLVLFQRWTSSGSMALAALGLVICLTSAAAMVFPESRVLEFLMPLRWCMFACSAATAGDYPASLLGLLPFAALAGLGWIGGTRYA